MKFISGIKHVKIVDKTLKIEIPDYHRVCIGFLSGTSVYYVYRNYDGGADNLGIRELILTTISPKIWHKIRKITINTFDEPGIIYKLTDKLKNIANVHIVEDISTEIDSNHTITLIIDLSMYYEQFGIDEHNPQLIDEVDEKIKNIITDAIKEMIVPKNENIPDSLTPNQKIMVDYYKKIKEPTDPIFTKLNFLFTNSEIFPEFFTHITHVNPPQYSLDQKIKINNGLIEIEERIKRSLTIDNNSSYTMFSDTEEKYMKILFFDDDQQKVIFIDVIHDDQPGAFAAFAKIIKDEEGNILGSYSRQQMGKSEAHWYALIDITKDSTWLSNNNILFKINDCPYCKNRSEENVFLIEVNNIRYAPDNIIAKYGQNKITKEKEYTTVFLRKVRIILDLIVLNKINNIQKAIEFIIKSKSVKYGNEELIFNKNDEKLLIKIFERIIPLSKYSNYFNIDSKYIDKKGNTYTVDELDKCILEKISPEILANINKSEKIQVIKRIINIIKFWAIVLLWLAILFWQDIRHFIFDAIKGALKATMEATIAYIVGFSLLVIFGDKIIEFIRRNLTKK